MTDFAPDSVFAQRRDVVATELDGELILLDPGSGDVFGLREVGLVIWQKLDAPMRFDALVLELQTEFEIDAAQCRADVAGFLGELLEAGFVSRQ